MSRYSRLLTMLGDMTAPSRLEHERALRRAMHDLDHHRVPNCSASTLRQAARLHTFLVAASVVAEGDATATAENADHRPFLTHHSSKRIECPH